MTKELRLPSAYVEVKENEMEYLDGNWGIFGTIFGAVKNCVKGIYNGDSFGQIAAQTVKGALCGFAGGTAFYFIGGAVACAIPGLGWAIVAGLAAGFIASTVVNHILSDTLTQIGW